MAKDDRTPYEQSVYNASKEIFTMFAKVYETVPIEHQNMYLILQTVLKGVIPVLDQTSRHMPYKERAMFFNKLLTEMTKRLEVILTNKYDPKRDI